MNVSGCLFILIFMDYIVFPVFGYKWEKILWTWMYKSVGGQMFSFHFLKYPRMVLLDHIIDVSRN